MASRGSLLKQLAELDLCRSFGLACLPQPDALANAVATDVTLAGKDARIWAVQQATMFHLPARGRTLVHLR